MNISLSLLPWRGTGRSVCVPSGACPTRVVLTAGRSRSLTRAAFSVDNNYYEYLLL